VAGPGSGSVARQASSLHSAPQQGRLGSDALMNPTHVVLVTTLFAVVREIRLTITWLMALYSRSPARRRIALDLVALMLTPYWRRGSGRSTGATLPSLSRHAGGGKPTTDD
jgi:hypothetical protein